MFNQVVKQFHKMSFNLDSSDDESFESDNGLVHQNNMSSKTPTLMENLIFAMNQIQDIFNTLQDKNTIELPQIVMLGSQSTGKSSVLESIVGRSFLPRGTGIVTRCPLVLQLIECKMDNKEYRKKDQGTTEVEEWGEFYHLEGQIFTDFDKIREEIERQTDMLAGNNKGICNTPIRLRIFSPNVVTLTLVDLPGITKVAVGDQPEDIEEQIMKLVMEYIKNKNSIILSVSAANSDIATSESLKFAKIVDPEGLRTLAILTKIDIMDKGTDAWDMLNGVTIPVRLGIIGIINRSQDDINKNKTIDEQLKDEKIFFEINYEAIKDRNGIPYLAKKLSELLKNHIFECIPDLKQKVVEKLAKYEKIIECCGEEIKDHDKFLFRVIASMSKEFNAIIHGKSAHQSKRVDSLFGGPKIREIFDQKFSEDLSEIEPEVNKFEIIQEIQNTGGPRLSIFAPEDLFQRLVNDQIERLRTPSIECLSTIKSQMEFIISRLIKNQFELKQFPKLNEASKKILKKLLNERIPIGEKFINELIDRELSSINTNHPEFSVEKALEGNSTGNNFIFDEFKTQKTEVHATVIEHLIKNYVPIVKKTVMDQVQKILLHHIIFYMRDNIQEELMHKLYKKGNDLFEESDDNVFRREESRQKIKALKGVYEIIENLEASL